MQTTYKIIEGDKATFESKSNDLDRGWITMGNLSVVENGGRVFIPVCLLKL